jgi:hypothetical protein
MNDKRQGKKRSSVLRQQCEKRSSALRDGSKNRKEETHLDLNKNSERTTERFTHGEEEGTIHRLFPRHCFFFPPSLRQSYLFNIWRRGEARKETKRSERPRFTLKIIVGGADKTEGETVRQGWVLTRVTEYIEFEK